MIGEKEMKKYNVFKIFMIITMFLTSIATVISPFLINIWIKNNENIDKSKIFLILILIIFSIAINILITWIREIFAKEFNKNNFKMYLKKFYKLEYDYILESGPMSLLERMIMGVNSLYTYLVSDVVMIYSRVISIGIILLIVFFQDKIIFLLFLSLIPIYYLSFKLLNKSLLHKSKQLQEISSKMWGDILSVLEKTDYIKQLSDKRYIDKIIDQKIEKVYKKQSNLNAFAQSITVFITGISTLFQTMIIIYSVLISLESGKFFNTILISIILPLFINSLSQITNSNVSKRDFKVSNDYFNSWKNFYEKSGKKDLAHINNISFDISTISISNKTFDIDLKDDFSKGDIVWVNGKSGSGKSSLLKLIVRFRDENSIYINKTDIREYDIDQLRDKIEYISQNIAIVNASLRENLFLDQKYSTEKEEKMKKDVLLNSILKNKTFDSIITANASNLSSGEKQKIALVRALYKNTDILILDEITSGIDIETSKLIYDRIKEISRDKIIFIVSHQALDENLYNKKIEIE